jgi:TonB family protein
MTRLPYVVASVAIALAGLQAPPTPAQYRSGPLPPIPTHAAGAGEVLLQVSVSPAGTVRDVIVLRSTAPFTALMTTAVQAWQFRPARQDVPVESSVLVAGVFRPPTINTPSLGGQPSDLESPGRNIPFPTRIVTPPYPPRAIDNAAVLVEVQVGPSGNVTDAKALSKTSGFDDAAVDAARRWVFRPAEMDAGPIQAVAYVVFGFRQPITNSRSR